MDRDFQIKKRIMSYKTHELKGFLMSVLSQGNKRQLQEHCHLLLKQPMRPQLLEAMAKVDRAKSAKRDIRSRAGQANEAGTGALAATASSSDGLNHAVLPPPRRRPIAAVAMPQVIRNESRFQHVAFVSGARAMQSPRQGPALITPGVKMVDIPFFERGPELIPLTTLIGHPIQPKQPGGRKKIGCTFRIRPVGDLVFYNVQTRRRPVKVIAIRFGDFTLASDEGELGDMFPPALTVVVNSSIVYDGDHVNPSVRKTTAYPINITKHLYKFVGSDIAITWEDNGKKTYVMSVLAGTPLPAENLREFLRDQPPLPWPNAIGIPKGAGTATSLNCPIGKIRMKFPCRGRACTHLQSFDGETFLQIYATTLKLDCPVCGRRLQQEDLQWNYYLATVIEDLPPSQSQVDTIIVYPNGYYELAVEVKPQQMVVVVDESEDGED